MTNATVKSPVRERASTTATLASAKERLRLAAYMALTCASPAEESAAIEKPALVNALAIVTKPQSQRDATSSDGLRLEIVAPAHA